MTDLRNTHIGKWRQFAKEVRAPGHHLLDRLDSFPGAILVAGCQRSGTTMLARVISGSQGMANYWTNKDDELDAALILSGKVDYEGTERHCFQTTYLNERYREYLQHCAFDKLIWVVREPVAVVTSMIKNWGGYAFRELFVLCGIEGATESERRRYAAFGAVGVTALRRACLCYNVKTAQVLELRRELDASRLLIIDYGELVAHKEAMLPRIYAELGLPYNDAYARSIKPSTPRRELSKRQQDVVRTACSAVYEEVRGLRTITGDE